MAGIASEEGGVARSVEGISRGQHCQSREALAEWRSSEQVENGTPSTLPPYWDTDDDDDGGPKPSELYGKYTWKIEKFSQINKRELRSNAFEVGSYKWYILIYPQGCDVCNHLSLFLCVANHDKLLPGWSHFAQFTIAVVNKDPKKSKYSDTLHRFWKKEHDWGWKKFMELSKVSDGFLDATDTLIIKAQVQVIREKADRPFRCLDCEYRRELVRVYLTNVEQICRRFVEERRGKLVRLIDDKDMWSSFHIFWSGMDRNTRHSMSRERTDLIHKVVVKHFFIEKEVTSTLVMDSLYSGLKALEGKTKCKKGRAKLLEAEEMPTPIVSVEKDTYVLVDDVLMLIERAAMEPLPPKDEKGPQNRTKDGNLGEDFNKDSIERDERRLTELGRRTVEIFILAHIFNQKIEVAYQEAVALKRQEELIREEEQAAWLAESDQKAKRGAIEKEKKLKKKQAKQKRNNRKVKDKEREVKSDAAVLEKQQEENPCDETKGSVIEEVQTVEEKSDILEDVSDASDSVDAASEVLQPDSEDRDASPVNWDTDASEVHPSTEASSTGVGALTSLSYGTTTEKRSTSVMDDSSSTCSTDSVPSVVMNGPYKGSSNNQSERCPSRGKTERGSATCNGSWTTEMDNQPSVASADGGDLMDDDTGNSKANNLDSETGAHALQDDMNHCEQRVVKKEEKVASLQRRSSAKDPIGAEGSSEKTVIPPSSRIPPNNLPAALQLKSEIKSSTNGDLAHIKKASPRIVHHPDRAVPAVTSLQSTGISKADAQNVSASKPPERPVIQHGALSRPSSVPPVPVPRPVAPVVSMVQTAPLLTCSVSAAGRLGPDHSPATHSYSPQSFRNAIIGSCLGSHSSSFPHTNSPSLEVNLSLAPTHPPVVSARMCLNPSSDRVEPTSVPSGFPYGMVNRDVFQNGTHWIDSSLRDENRSMFSDPSPVMNGFQNLDFYRSLNRRSCKHSVPTPACSSGRQSQGTVIDEFPHLDIINDLLEDEQGVGNAEAVMISQSFNNGPQILNRQFSLPCDSGVPSDLGSSTSGSCRFERAISYQERGYTQFDTSRDFVPQATPVAYGNGHIDGLIPGQWQMAGPDLLVGMLNADGEASPYCGSDYSNLACVVNAYPFLRPSNGL